MIRDERVIQKCHAWFVGVLVALAFGLVKESRAYLLVERWHRSFRLFREGLCQLAGEVFGLVILPSYLCYVWQMEKIWEPRDAQLVQHGAV